MSAAITAVLTAILTLTNPAPAPSLTDCETPRGPLPCVIPAETVVCWSVTNYWPFDEEGNPVPWGGQADGSPSYTANGYHITPEHDWHVAAVPYTLINSTLVFPNGHTVYAADTFGHETYQRGVFWHDGWETWVIGVDVLTSEPVYYLECGGMILP